MSSAFDIGLEALTGAQRASQAAALPDEDAMRGTFFLETFGCQMNEHDSEKGAGLLLARGYRQVESPQAAALVFYNTFNIQEQTAQKVFSRLAEVRGQPSDSEIIRDLGCEAHLEGED